MVRPVNSLPRGKDDALASPRTSSQTVHQSVTPSNQPAIVQQPITSRHDCSVWPVFRNSLIHGKFELTTVWLSWYIIIVVIISVTTEQIPSTEEVWKIWTCWKRLLCGPWLIHASHPWRLPLIYLTTNAIKSESPPESVNQHPSIWWSLNTWIKYPFSDISNRASTHPRSSDHTWVPNTWLNCAGLTWLVRHKAVYSEQSLTVHKDISAKPKPITRKIYVYLEVLNKNKTVEHNTATVFLPNQGARSSG